MFEREDWSEATCISICLKKDETLLEDEFKNIANNTIHYGIDFTKTYYKITKNGIFIKFLKKDNKKEGIYGIHFIPHNNIVLFEAYDSYQ